VEFSLPAYSDGAVFLAESNFAPMKRNFTLCLLLTLGGVLIAAKYFARQRQHLWSAFWLEWAIITLGGIFWFKL
jgi:hypothetical protein